MRYFREIQASLNGKLQDIQLEESQIIWTVKALHVVLKLHMGMHDFIHSQAEETFKESQWFT